MAPPIPGATPRRQDDGETDRQRLDVLLGEYRIVVPMVGVLAAFQLTVPFQPGFAQLSSADRMVNLGALLCSLVTLLFLLVPVTYHRATRRFDDSPWALALTRRCVALAFLFLPVSLCASFYVQANRAMPAAASAALSAALLLAFTVAWWLLPYQLARRQGRR